MAWIQRPTIGPNVEPIAPLLDHLLAAVVTRLAQRLERPEPELVDVAAVRLNVIADRSGFDNAALEAERAQQVRQQLMAPDARPALGRKRLAAHARP